MSKVPKCADCMMYGNASTQQDCFDCEKGGVLTNFVPAPETPRLSWPAYHMAHALLAACRSTCTRRQVGAVAVSVNHLLATGYNGAPARAPHCQTAGCLREERGIPSGQQLDICRAVHAEQNLVAQAASHGISLMGAHVYCTHTPCATCAKILVNVGVTQIFALHQYPDPFSSRILLEGGVVLNILTKAMLNSTGLPAVLAGILNQIKE